MRRFFYSIPDAADKSSAFQNSWRKACLIISLIVLTLSLVQIPGAHASTPIGSSAGVHPEPAPTPIFVYPRFDCLDKYNPATNAATAYFGYTSFMASDIAIPQGNNNIFIQDPQFRIQPTVFH